jgi:hypothetical protein
VTIIDPSSEFREVKDEDWAELSESYRPRSMLLDVILDLRKRGFTHARISRDLLFMASQEAQGVRDLDEARELVDLFRFAAEAWSRQAKADAARTRAARRAGHRSAGESP